MKLKILKLLLVSQLFFLTGCWPNPKINISNRSDQPLMVKNGNKIKVISPGEHIKVNSYDSNGDAIVLDLIKKQVDIGLTLGNVTLDYWTQIHKLYPRGYGIISLVVDENKKISLGGLSEQKITVFPIQPEGFGGISSQQ